MTNLQSKRKNLVLLPTGSVNLLPLVLILLDYAALMVSENISFGLRNIFIPQGGTLYISWLNFYVLFPVCFMIFIQAHGLYTKMHQFWRVIAALFQASLYGIVTVVILLYVGHIAGSTSRLFVALLWLTAFIMLVIFRYAGKQLLRKMDFLGEPVLLMGAGKTAVVLLPHMLEDSGLNYRFIGFLEDGVPEPEVAAALPCLGGFRDAPKVIAETGVRNLIVMAPGLNSTTVQELVYRLQPLVNRISFIPDLGSLPVGTLEFTSLVDGHAVMFRLKNNLASWYNQFLKRVFDFTLTLLGTVLISPVLIAIALWIRKDSPGPIIFKHKRLGRNGREFSCYKFRSMCVDADAKLEELLRTDPAAKTEWEKEFKLKDDPRITKSGAFLRKTSLDELPQIFNVLKGEMSLVGPRPIIQAEVLRYGKYIQDYYMVRPGITGMWQTSGRSDVDYAERVQLDTWYVRNWNVWFDVVLLWRTFSVVVHKKGAY